MLHLSAGDVGNAEERLGFIPAALLRFPGSFACRMRKPAKCLEHLAGFGFWARYRGRELRFFRIAHTIAVPMAAAQVSTSQSIGSQLRPGVKI